MKKVKASLVLILIFIIIYFLQINIFTWFNIAGIMPNLFIVFALFMGLFLGKKLGVVFSIIMGIILDILVGKTIGISGIILAIVSLMGEYFDKNFSKNNRIMIILMTIGCTIFYELVMYMINMAIFQIEADIPNTILILGIETIYNIFLVIIFYPIIEKVGYYLEDIFKGKKYLTGYF